MSKHRVDAGENKHSTHNKIRTISRSKNLRIKVDDSIGCRQTQCQIGNPISLPIKQTLNEFWPQNEMYLIEGPNPQDALQTYTEMLNHFRSQFPDSMQLLLAHHLDEVERSYVLARGKSTQNGFELGVILSRLLQIAQSHWMVTLVDTDSKTNQRIEPWISSLFDAAARLDLGVERVFIFNGEHCVVADPDGLVAR
ncbi:MAG: hypothetical protein VYA30_07055 [Myxococcota bacterium]|nr:hypothetical protein [Myxococcota bacterium]